MAPTPTVSHVCPNTLLRPENWTLPGGGRSTGHNEGCSGLAVATWPLLWVAPEVTSWLAMAEVDGHESDREGAAHHTHLMKTVQLASDRDWNIQRQLQQVVARASCRCKRAAMLAWAATCRAREMRGTDMQSKMSTSSKRVGVVVVVVDGWEGGWGGDGVGGEPATVQPAGATRINSLRYRTATWFNGASSGRCALSGLLGPVAALPATAGSSSWPPVPGPAPSLPGTGSGERFEGSQRTKRGSSYLRDGCGAAAVAPGARKAGLHRACCSSWSRGQHPAAAAQQAHSAAGASNRWHARTHDPANAERSLQGWSPQRTPHLRPRSS